MPSFGLESIDFSLMHRQTLAFTDLILRLDQKSQVDIAGKVSEYRRQREAGQGGPPCRDPLPHAHLFSSAISK